jgi:hypothetical protein
MKSFNRFSDFCENKNYSYMLLNVLKNAAERGMTSTKFINKILEPCYFQEWENHLDFIKALNNRMSLINETTADEARQRIAAIKEKHYAHIIKATKESFRKLLDKMHFKAAIDMDAQGSEPEAIKKRFIIKDLYDKLLGFVEKYDTEFELATPEEKPDIHRAADTLKAEFERGVMPYVNEYLKTNIDPRYDSYNTIIDKINGSRESGVRKLGGVAKDALARKIYAALRKEGMEPVYRRKIELLARAIGAEPRTLEQIRQERGERETRASAASAESARRAAEYQAERDAAIARGDTRFNPDLDSALGL